MPVQLSSASAAMHGALVPIAYVSLASDQSEVLFSNIPQTYQDLMVVSYVRNAEAGTSVVDLNMYAFNLDFGNTCSYTMLQGNGATASSNRAANVQPILTGWHPQNGNTAGIYGVTISHILNYRNTTTFKTVLSRSACDLDGSGRTSESVGLWSNTAAINAFRISYGTFKSGSTFALYGIRSVGQ
jgi:hypothetical protein